MLALILVLCAFVSNVWSQDPVIGDASPVTEGIVTVPISHVDVFELRKGKIKQLPTNDYSLHSDPLPTAYESIGHKKHYISPDSFSLIHQLNRPIIRKKSHYHALWVGADDEELHNKDEELEMYFNRKDGSMILIQDDGDADKRVMFHHHDIVADLKAGKRLYVFSDKGGKEDGITRIIAKKGVSPGKLKIAKDGKEDGITRHYRIAKKPMQIVDADSRDSREKREKPDTASYADDGDYYGYAGGNYEDDIAFQGISSSRLLRYAYNLGWHAGNRKVDQIKRRKDYR